jgi:hypothetical protein
VVGGGRLMPCLTWIWHFFLVRSHWSKIFDFF